MSFHTEDYAWLAKDSYQDRFDYVGDNRKTVDLSGHQYKVIDCAASKVNGFHATAYQQVESPHSIVIAYRGTDPDYKHHSLTTAQDLMVDGAMVAAKVNPQEADARKFTQQVLDYAKQHGIPADQISVAGHSLGGTLAEIEASHFGLHGQTFNAYGAVDLGYRIPEGGNQIIDNVMAGDTVSAASRHFGSVHIYATREDIDDLRQGGYLDGSLLHSPIVGARYSDHGIDHFAPNPGKGSGVLTAANEALAQEYAEPIARYRHDVYTARTELHDAVQLNPVERLKGNLGVDEELVKAGAVYAERLGERTAQAAVRDLRAAEGAVKREADAIGYTLRETANDFSTLLNDVRHPDYALYQSAFGAVRRMESAKGIAGGEHSQRLAAALTVAARRDGLDRIDQVALSDDGKRAFAVEGELSSPLRKIAFVDTDQAVHTSFAQHSVQAQAAYQQHQQALQQQQLQERQVQPAPQFNPPEFVR